MAETFYIKQNDTAAKLRVTLKDASETVVDVTGATVKFTMFLPGAASAKIDEGSVTLIDATNGVVEYAWAAGDTDTAGIYLGEFEVTYSDSTIQTFPNSDKFKLEIIIRAELS